MNRREALLALNLLPGIGPVRVRRLIDALGSPEAVLQSSSRTLQQIDGIGPETASNLVSWQEKIDLGRELRRIHEIGATVVTAEDDCWPKNLLTVYDPPLVLYVWGQIEPRDGQAIAVVGSRRATHYGLQSANRISQQLAQCGITVLSGLALGIDTAAHQGALAGNGRTIAVIGSGLGKLYPPQNMELAQRIADGHGAVVSEFPVDYNPDKQSFPLRNRIVAGWSHGVLCVEAPSKSGALITCQQAADYGRTLYAVPGNIDRPGSQGCNRLIQDGAQLVMSADDIMEDLEWLLPMAQKELAKTASSGRPALVLSSEEKKVWEVLSTDETAFDDVVQRSGLPVPTATVALMKLEIKKAIKQLPGRYYVRLG